MSRSSSINLLHYHYLPSGHNQSSSRFCLTAPSSYRWSSPEDDCSILAMPTTTLPRSISPFNVPHSVVSFILLWFLFIIILKFKLMNCLHTTRTIDIYYLKKKSVASINIYIYISELIMVKPRIYITSHKPQHIFWSSVVSAWFLVIWKVLWINFCMFSLSGLLFSLVKFWCV